MEFFGADYATDPAGRPVLRARKAVMVLCASA